MNIYKLYCNNLTMYNSKTKLAKASDFLFAFLSTFIIAKLILNNTITANIKQKNLISLTFSLLILFILLNINKKQTIKNQIKQEDKKQFSNMIYFLETSHQKNIVLFFKSVFANKITSVNNTHIELENNTKIFFLFDTETISKDDLLRLTKTYNLQKFNNFIVFCFNFNNLAQHFAENNTNNKIKLFNQIAIFNLLKQKNIFPPIIQNQKQDKPQHKLKNIISRDKAKTYCFAQISIYFASFFNRAHSLTYLFFSSLCFVLCISCLLFSKKQPKTETLNF